MLWRHSNYRFLGGDGCCAHEIKSVRKWPLPTQHLSGSLGPFSPAQCRVNPVFTTPNSRLCATTRARRPSFRVTARTLRPHPWLCSNCLCRPCRQLGSQFTGPCLSHCSGQQGAKEHSPAGSTHAHPATRKAGASFSRSLPENAFLANKICPVHVRGWYFTETELHGETQICTGPTD